MSLKTEEAERAFGPRGRMEPALTKDDERLAGVLAKFDPYGPPLIAFQSGEAWSEAMDFIVRGAVVKAVSKFARLRPDEVYRKVFGEKRVKTRAHFRWSYQPEHPWSEIVAYKEHSTVRLIPPVVFFG